MAFCTIIRDAIRARVTDKIRDIKGKAGKADRSDAIKQVLTDLLTEMAPPAKLLCHHRCMHFLEQQARRLRRSRAGLGRGRG